MPKQVLSQEFSSVLASRLKSEGKQSEAPAEKPGVILEQKPVAKLAHHTGAVNVVRWSPCGTLLASGGAEGTVAIWQLLVAGTGENERWSVVREHKFHRADVIDISWSSDLANMASSSLDFTVVVYNVMTQTQITVTLDFIIKGLAWDPLTDFLAGAGEGKNGLTIWKLTKTGDTINSLNIVKSIRKPYEEYQLPSQFRRFKYIYKIIKNIVGPLLEII